MAINFPNIGDYIRTVGVVGNVDPGFDFSLFVQVKNTGAEVAVGERKVLFALFTGGTEDFTDPYLALVIEESGGNQVIKLETDAGSSASTAAAIETWLAGGVGITYDATTHVLTLYVNGIAIGTTVRDFSADPFTSLVLGNADASAIPGVALSYARSWYDVKLSGAQFLDEATNHAGAGGYGGLSALRFDSSLEHADYITDESMTWVLAGTQTTTVGPITLNLFDAGLAVVGQNSGARRAYVWKADGTLLTRLHTPFDCFDLGSVAVDKVGKRIYLNGNGDINGTLPSQHLIAVYDETGVLINVIRPTLIDAGIGTGYALYVPTPGKLWVAIEDGSSSGTQSGELWEYTSLGVFQSVKAVFHQAAGYIQAAYGMVKQGSFLYFNALGNKKGLWRHDLISGGNATHIINYTSMVGGVVANPSGYLILSAISGFFNHVRRYSPAGALQHDSDMGAAIYGIQMASPSTLWVSDPSVGLYLLNLADDSFTQPIVFPVDDTPVVYAIGAPAVSTDGTEPVILKCDTGTDDDDEEFQGYVTTRAIPPSGSITKLGSIGQPAMLVASAEANVPIQLATIVDFGRAESDADVDLTPDAAETRVVRKFENAAAADISAVQFRLGDAEAIANQWELDYLHVPSIPDGDG